MNLTLIDGELTKLLRQSKPLAANDTGIATYGDAWEKSGEGEIRTPVTIARKPVFETGAFSRSATSPGGNYKI